jgi:hypothetical protein
MLAGQQCHHGKNGRYDEPTDRCASLSSHESLPSFGRTDLRFGATPNNDMASVARRQPRAYKPICRTVSGLVGVSPEKIVLKQDAQGSAAI